MELLMANWELNYGNNPNRYFQDRLINPSNNPVYQSHDPNAPNYKDPNALYGNVQGPPLKLNSWTLPGGTDGTAQTSIYGPANNTTIGSSLSGGAATQVRNLITSPQKQDYSATSESTGINVEDQALKGGAGDIVKTEERIEKGYDVNLKDEELVAAVDTKMAGENITEGAGWMDLTDNQMSLLGMIVGSVSDAFSALANQPVIHRTSRPSDRLYKGKYN